MRVLATRRFLREARRSETVRTRLPQLAESTPPRDEPVTERLGTTLLGWTRKQTQVELWYAMDERSLPADATDPPLAALSRAELRALGLAEERIGQVQQVRSLAELEALGLPSQQLGVLRFQLVQSLGGPAASPEALTRCAEDLGELDRYLRGDLKELLLRLDDGQRRIVELAGGGPILVRGVAGSGKTAVAIHRIRALLRQRSLLEEPPVLYLTFNRSLVHAAGEMLEALGIESGRLELATLHQWCKRYVGAEARRVLSPARQRALLDEAREAARAATRESAIWSWPSAFWHDELHLIKGRLSPGAREDYLRLARHGAGRPLDNRLRELVWRVLEEYAARCAREGAIDWDDVICLAHRKLVAAGPLAPRYKHVFVDEAQDLTPMGMRVAALLAGPPGDLLAAYDPAQSIYERGFRWKDCGLTVHGGRSFDLRRNYRSTAQILEAARPLLAGMEGSRRGEEAETVLQPELAARQGPSPRMLVTPPRGELGAVAADLRRLIERERVPPRNIAVLCYPNAVRDELFEELRRASIYVQKHDDQSAISISDSSVKLLPVKSAKGLEFPVVYLIASGRMFQVPRALRGDEVEAAAWREEMRRVFYMAMTRAMTSLIVVHAEGDPAPFLPPACRGPGRA